MPHSMPPLPPCERRALFLDFDGTLVDIAPTPDSVAVPEGLGALLAALNQKHGGALAIITGRRIADIDAMIGAQDVPIAGVHGAEFRHGARQPTSRMTAGVGADALAAVRAAAERVAGAWVEDKRSALSVHFRDVAPHEIEPLAARLNAALSTWTDRLTMRPGRKVFEIVQRDISKAAALGAMMKAPPFAGRVPVMIGDDHADDVAMQAAVRLGGFGLGVAGEYFTQDASTFRNPAEVRAWLHRQINEETP